VRGVKIAIGRFGVVLFVAGCGGTPKGATPTIDLPAATAKAPVPNASAIAVVRTPGSGEGQLEACYREKVVYDDGTKRIVGWRLDGSGRVMQSREAWSRPHQEKPTDQVYDFIWGDDGRLQAYTMEQHGETPISARYDFQYGPHGELVEVDTQDTLVGQERTRFTWDGTFTPPPTAGRVLEPEPNYPTCPVPLPRRMGEPWSAMGPHFGFKGTVRIADELSSGSALQGTRQYDDQGRLVRDTFADNPVLTFRYDEEGRLVEMRESDGSVSSFEWDGSRVVRKVFLREGKTADETIEYDAKGRRVRAKYEGTTTNTVSTFVYDCARATSDPFVE
jgi:YD repeat-containing protein